MKVATVGFIIILILERKSLIVNIEFYCNFLGNNIQTFQNMAASQPSVYIKKIIKRNIMQINHISIHSLIQMGMVYSIKIVS